MEAAPFQKKLHCPNCSQRIALPTDDLSKAYRCPRCKTVHVAGEIIDHGVTLQAVPAVAVVVEAIALEDVLPAPPLEPIPAHLAITPVELKTYDEPVPDTSRVVASPATAVVFAHTTALAAPLPPPAPQPVALPPPAPVVPAEKTQPRIGAVTRLAVQVDAAFGSYRRWTWIAVLGLFIVSGWIDALIERSVFNPISWALLALMLVLAFLTKLDLFIDDDGRFRFWSGVTRLWSGAVERLRRDEDDETTSTDQLRTARAWTFAIALVVFATEKVIVTAASAKESTSLAYVGGALLLIWLVFHLLVVRTAKASTTAPVVSESPAASQQIAGQLPPVLAMSERRTVEQVLAATSAGLVREFLSTVAAWAPRGCTDEKDYKYKLLRRIMRTTPGVSAKTEFGVARDGRVGRIDLVIGEQLGVELKFNLRPADMRDALAQVDDYMQMWPGKPMFLLLCGRALQPDHAKTFFGPEIARLRSEGRSVTVVILGA